MRPWSNRPHGSDPRRRSHRHIDVSNRPPPASARHSGTGHGVEWRVAYEAARHADRPHVPRHAHGSDTVRWREGHPKNHDGGGVRERTLTDCRPTDACERYFHDQQHRSAMGRRARGASDHVPRCRRIRAPSVERQSYRAADEHVTRGMMWTPLITVLRADTHLPQHAPDVPLVEEVVETDGCTAAPASGARNALSHCHSVTTHGRSSAPATRKGRAGESGVYAPRGAREG